MLIEFNEENQPIPQRNFLDISPSRERRTDAMAFQKLANLFSVRPSGDWNTHKIMSKLHYRAERGPLPVPFAEFIKKAKCARSSESLPTGLLCNQYNQECDGESAIRIRAEFRGYLKQKNNPELMKHRQFLHTLAVISTALFCSTHLDAQVLRAGNHVSLRCLGNIPGPRYLDGRTANGTVGLAPNMSPEYSGTRWRVVRSGDGVVELKCLGDIDGPRWLDGRTAEGTVGLAPNTNKPFTGTRWQVVQVGYNNPNIVALRCLGDIDGPRWLNGKTAEGTVDVAPTTEPPFTGTKWEVLPID